MAGYRVLVRQRSGIPGPTWYSLWKQRSTDVDPTITEIAGAKTMKTINTAMEREFTKASISNFPVEVHDPTMEWFAKLGPGGSLQAAPASAYYSPWIEVVESSDAGDRTVFLGYMDGASLEHDVRTATTSFSVLPAHNLLKDRKLKDFPEFLRPDPEMVQTGPPPQGETFTVKSPDQLMHDGWSATAGYYSRFYQDPQQGTSVSNGTPMVELPAPVNEPGPGEPGPGPNFTGAPLVVRTDHDARLQALLAQGKIPFKIWQAHDIGFREWTDDRGRLPNQPYDGPEILRHNIDDYSVPWLGSNTIKIGDDYYQVHAEVMTGDDYLQYWSLEDTIDYVYWTEENWNTWPPQVVKHYYELQTWIVSYWRVGLLVLDTAADLRGTVAAGNTITFTAPTQRSNFYNVVVDVKGESQDKSYRGDAFLGLNTVDKLVPGDRIQVNYVNETNDPQSKEEVVTAIDGAQNRVFFAEVFSTSDIPASRFGGVIRLGNDPVQVPGLSYLRQVCAPFTLDSTQFVTHEFPYPTLSWVPYDVCVDTPLFGAFWLQGIGTHGVHVSRRGPREAAQTSGQAGYWRGTWDALSWMGQGSPTPDIRNAIMHFGNYNAWVNPNADSQAYPPPALFHESALRGTERLNGLALQPWRSRRKKAYNWWWANASTDAQIDNLDITSATASQIDWSLVTSGLNRNAWIHFMGGAGRAVILTGAGAKSWAHANSADSFGGYADGSATDHGMLDRTAARLVAVGHGMDSTGKDGLMLIEEATNGGRVIVWNWNLTTKLADATFTNDSMGRIVRWDCGGGLAVQTCLDSCVGWMTYAQRTRLHYLLGTTHLQLDIPRVEVVAHTICPVEWDAVTLVPSGWAMLALEDYAPEGKQEGVKTRLRYILVRRILNTLRVVNGELEPDPVYPQDRAFDFRRGEMLADNMPNAEIPVCMCRIDQDNTLAGIVNGRPFLVARSVVDFIDKVEIGTQTAFGLLEAYCTANLAAAIPAPNGSLRLVSRAKGELHYYQPQVTTWESFANDAVRNERITAMAREFISEVTVAYYDPATQENREVVVTSGFSGGLPARMDLSTIISSPLVARTVGYIYANFYGSPAQKRTVALHHDDARSPVDLSTWKEWQVGDRVFRTAQTPNIAEGSSYKITRLDWDLDGHKLNSVELVQLPGTPDAGAPA